MIQGLTPSSDPKPDGKQYYEPAVLTVTGYSQYNENEISFKEIDGFWSLPNDYCKVGNDDKRPPQGAVAKFNLSTKPKNSPRANPGSMYRDITGIYKIAEGEQPIAQQPSYEQPQGDPRDEYVAPQQPTLSVDQRIAKAQAWNGLTAMLAAHGARGGTLADEQLDEMWTEWHEGYALLKAGKTPFTVEETEWENPAEELDQQAAQHLSEQQPGFQSTPEHNAQQPAWEAQGAGVQEEEDIQSVPW